MKRADSTSVEEALVADERVAARAAGRGTETGCGGCGKERFLAVRASIY
jgi:hypothetical protein